MNTCLELARGTGRKLVLHKPGYVDAIENLTSSTSAAWMMADLVGPAGQIGMAIDESDGAGRKLSADRVNVTLRPLPQP